MQLEFICDMNLIYQEESLTGEKFLLLRPYGGEEGAGFGNAWSRRHFIQLMGASLALAGLADVIAHELRRVRLRATHDKVARCPEIA